MNKTESSQVMSEEFPKYLSDGIFHKIRIMRNSESNYFGVLLANNIRKDSDMIPNTDFSMNLRTVRRNILLARKSFGGALPSARRA